MHIKDLAESQSTSWPREFTGRVVGQLLASKKRPLAKSATSRVTWGACQARFLLLGFYGGAVLRRLKRGTEKNEKLS